MVDNKKKAVAYSLLSQIRNSGTFLEGPIDYFIPLVKRSLNSLNSKGVKSGKSIIEIWDEIFNLFSLDIPIPVLTTILKKVEVEENITGNENFKIYNDNAFQLRDYHFYEYEQLFQEKTNEITDLNILFKEFCEINEFNTDFSIVEYIDKNKRSLLKHLDSNLRINTTSDGYKEAKFISYFKNIPSVYNLIKDIYLGSLISTYLEFEITEYKEEVELLLDTNFIISLLDLNTPESTKTCTKVIDLSLRRGYRISVMNDTIKEIQQLLTKKSENINNSTLIKYVNPEDILNACERRKLTKVDLERISDNMQNTLNKLGFNILFIQENTRSKAKQSVEYRTFKELRFSKISALHDATALLYVRDKRGKRITKFENAKCWFVNNSINNFDNTEGFDKGEYLSEIIRADELLSILWLSNPEIKRELDEDEFAAIGLNSMISISLNSSIPKASVIKELEDNIFKYSGEGITEKDIINLATRIANSQIRNVQEFNEIASDDNKEEFVRRIKIESEKQEEIEKTKNYKLDAIYDKLKRKIKFFDSEIDAQSQNSKSLEKENIELMDEIAFLKDELERDRIKTALKKWRRQPWYLLYALILCFILTLLYVFYLAEWDVDKVTNVVNELKTNIYLNFIFGILTLIFSIFVLQDFVSKYKNHTNIKAFKESVKNK